MKVAASFEQKGEVSYGESTGSTPHSIRLFHCAQLLNVLLMCDSDASLSSAF
jgi:hypothetical protein